MESHRSAAGSGSVTLVGDLTEPALGVDADGGICCANRPACELLGLSESRLRARRISDLDDERSAAFWGRFLRRHSGRQRLNARFRTGSDAVVAVTVVFVRARSAQICILRRSATAERPSSPSADAASVLLKRFPFPQFVVRLPDCRILDADVAAAAFHGCARSRLPGSSLGDWVDLSPTKLQGELEHALDCGALHLELPLRVGGGRAREVSVLALSASDAGDSVIRLLILEAGDLLQLNCELASYRDLIENLPVGVFRTSADPSGRILMANQALCDILGVASPSQLIGEEPASFYADPEGRGAFMEQVRAGSPVSVGLHRMVTRKGRSIWVRMTARRRTDELGRVFFEGAMQDLTEWRSARASVMLAERIVEHASEGIVVTDAGSNIVAINPSFSRITGYAASDVLGRNPRMLSSGQQSGSFYAQMWDEIRRTDHWQGEILNRRKSGEVYPEWLTISAIRDESGEIQNYAAVFTDLTAIRRSREKLEQLERSDPLTGLCNRNEFISRLEPAIEQAVKQGRQLCLVVAGIDDFTRLNNAYSFEVGDEILIALANRFLQLRDHGAVLVGRTQSDEFALLFEQSHDLTAVDARIIQVLECAREPIASETGSLPPVQMTAGASLCPTDARTALSLLGHSEATLGHAKKLNRGDYRLFRRELEAAEERRIWLRQELACAVEADRLELAYQPIVALPSGKIAGVEALARWHHPTEGWLRPDEFIAIAEESRLIDRLTFRLLDAACRFVADVRARFLSDLELAFNFSTMQLTSPDFPARTLHCLSDSGLPAACFKLELTESLLMTDIERSLGCIRTLQEAGLNISIDDFGTGFSSLAYLQEIRPQALKIDRRFIRDLPENREDATIASTIIAMAHKLGQKVIAEGVETEAQLEFLIAEGCDYYQGYLCSRPMSSAAFEQFLVEGTP